MSRRAQVLALVCAGTFLTALDVTIVNVAYRTMRSAFHASPLLPWVLSAYNIAFAAGLLTAGRMADSYGRKRAFLAGVSVFGLASVLCGAARLAWVLVLARVFQATGAALIVPSAMALVMPEFPVERRAAAVGITAATGGLGASTGPVLGGVLVDHFGWPWIFWAEVPVCALIVLFGYRLLHESRESVSPQSRVRALPDFLGAGLAVCAVGLLTLGLVQSDSWGVGSTRFVACVVSALVFGVLFVRRTRSVAVPVLDLGLFKLRFAVGANVAGVLYAAGFYSFNFTMIQWLREVWEYSPSRAGVAAIAAPIASMMTSPIGGRLAQRFGHIRVAVPGLLLFAATTLSMATLLGVNRNYVRVFLPCLIAVGVAIGLSISVLSSAANAYLPSHRFAMGSALYATGRQVGGALGIAIVAAITSASAQSANGYRWSWRYVSVVMVGAAIAMAALFRRPTESELAASRVRQLPAEEAECLIS